MIPISQALLDQFPALPTYEATWRAIYIEPIMSSGERLTVAVVALGSDGCEALKTLAHARLTALFGTQADGMASMIDLALDAVVRHGQGGCLDDFQSPLSGVFLGKSRDGLGEDRADILQQAASLTCFLYHQEKMCA